MLVLIFLLLIVFFRRVLHWQEKSIIKRTHRQMCPYLDNLTINIISDSEGTSCKQI